MPDERGNTKADEETTPDTPHHAYRDGREEDIEGDVDKLESEDPKDSQRAEIANDDEDSGAGMPNADKA